VRRMPVQNTRTSWGMSAHACTRGCKVPAVYKQAKNTIRLLVRRRAVCPHAVMCLNSETLNPKPWTPNRPSPCRPVHGSLVVVHPHTSQQQVLSQPPCAFRPVLHREHLLPSGSHNSSRVHRSPSALAACARTVKAKKLGESRGEGRVKPQRASRSAWPSSGMPLGEAAGELSAEDACEDSDDEPRAVRRPCLMAARGAEGMATKSGMSRCAESSSIVLCPCDVPAFSFPFSPITAIQR
jgi:hypothetical protein